MSIPLRALLLSTILGIAATAQSQVNIVNFDFAAVPIACGQDYAYQMGQVTGCAYKFVWPMQNFNSTPGFGWTLSGLLATQGCSGLTGPNTSFLPPPFGGLPFTQAVALEGPSFVWQNIGGFTAGSYTLSFYLGSRYASGQYDGNQTVQVLIDGNVINTWNLTSFTPFTLQTVPFTVSTDGSHVLEFKGLRHYDSTAFLS
ncbi:MAG: hypothetical protein ACLPPV_11190 [Candidatus Korobacteraceae bacterium]